MISIGFAFLLTRPFCLNNLVLILALLNEYSYDRLPTTITTIQEESLWLLVQNVVAGIVKKTALSKNDS
ncbi:MAG: hypothetical protein KKA35_00765, partial [Proteobacteria bacterium]|nr:hypothetical protein [Pseudomonadota bacterium]